MADLKPDPSGQPPFQSVQRFLHLLDDINHMQDQLLAETETLRARVLELEARAKAQAPAGPEQPGQDQPGQGGGRP